jgi:protein-disulfide isomerase
MSDKQSASSDNMTRKQRRAAERAARKSGRSPSAGSGSTGSGSVGRPSPSLLVISAGAVAIGIVAVIALVLLSGGLDGNEAAAVSEPDTPAPAEELRQGRTLVAPDAVDPVVVEVFEDPQCPHCQTFTERVEPLIIAEHVTEGTASLTYRDFVVFGEKSLDASVAMRAAEELDGAFWDYHHVLYHNAPDGAFTREWLTDIAESIGLDRDRFAELLDDEGLVAAVAADEAQGAGLGVNSTPSVIVDGERLESASWEEIDAAIENATASS